MTPAAETILREVALRRQVSTLRILSTERTRPVAHARQEVFARCYALRSGNGTKGAVYSLPQIGGWFDRDHTTVLHGVRAHEKRLAEERS